MKSFKKERFHRTPISNANKGGTNEAENVVGPPCPSEWPLKKSCKTLNTTGLARLQGQHRILL